MLDPYANEFSPPSTTSSSSSSSVGQRRPSTSLSDESAFSTTSPRIPVSPSSSTQQFKVPNDDFFTYLLGSWKRNLEWKEFGKSFSHLTTSNSFVVIEKARVDASNQTSYAKWSFGKSLERTELQFGYQMKFVHAPQNPETYLEWQFGGTVCYGKFLPGTGVAVLNFFLPSSTVVATYSLLDADTMAVCICEVDSRYKPSIQYGNMYRIDPSLYVR